MKVIVPGGRCVGLAPTEKPKVKADKPTKSSGSKPEQ